MPGRPSLAIFTAPVLVLVLAGLAAAMTYGAARTPALHDVASVARMPIPGRADVTLAAKSYGLYYGMTNAPSRVALRAPKLRITIVPPKGIDDPAFEETPSEVDVLVDGFHTVQVARIDVRASGRYHVKVDSPDESGGSFSIGELPSEVGPEQAMRRATLVGLGGLGLSALLFVWAALVHRARLRAQRT